MIEFPALAAAFLLGLMGSSHCLFMCGGITAALGAQAEGSLTRRFFLLLSCHAGRIGSYMLAGLVAGLFGLWLREQHDAVGLWMRVAAGLVLVAMGFVVAGWFPALAALERGGEFLFQYLGPLLRRLVPVNTPGRGVLAGAIWGFLPCGLVYGALGFATTSGNVAHAALLMAAFGLGTLPALLATGFFAQQLRNLLGKKLVRQLAGVLVMLFGIWMMAGVLSHSTESSADGSEHEHHHAH